MDWIVPCFGWHLWVSGLWTVGQLDWIQTDLAVGNVTPYGTKQNIDYALHNIHIPLSIRFPGYLSYLPTIPGSYVYRGFSLDSLVALRTRVYRSLLLRSHRIGKTITQRNLSIFVIILFATMSIYTQRSRTARFVHTNHRLFGNSYWVH